MVNVALEEVTQGCHSLSEVEVSAIDVAAKSSNTTRMFHAELNLFGLVKLSSGW